MLVCVHFWFFLPLSVSPLPPQSGCVSVYVALPRERERAREREGEKERERRKEIVTETDKEIERVQPKMFSGVGSEGNISTLKGS